MKGSFMEILWTIPVLICIGVSDWKKRIIPNEIVFLLIAIAGIELLFAGQLQSNISLSERTLGMLIPTVVLFFIYLINPRASGGGDLKLIAALGFCIGKSLIAVLFIACIGGLFHCLIFREKEAPFGSYILLGAIVISILSLV